MTVPGGYRIGREITAGLIFAPVYLILGFLFGEPSVAIGVFVLLAVCIAVEYYGGIEWPLAIAIRTVHIIFIAAIAILKMKGDR